VAGQFHYHFEWDTLKARQNLKRHGVAFDRAATIFLDRSALSEFDEAHSETEERWITLGLDNTGVVLVVCHTFRDENESSARLRLISARKATKREEAEYERRKIR
jgi:hypothetical protein